MKPTTTRRRPTTPTPTAKGTSRRPAEPAPADPALAAALQDAIESLEHTPRRLLRARRIIDAAASHIASLRMVRTTDDFESFNRRMSEEAKAAQLVLVQLLFEIRRIEADVDGARLYLTGVDDELEGGFEIDDASLLVADRFWGYLPTTDTAEGGA